MTELRGLKIYTSGELTIVTIEDKGYLGTTTFLGDATEHLEAIVERNKSSVLVIDLEGITALPSLMLGVLVALQHRGIEIRLFNVSPDVRLILEVMNLDQVFQQRDGDLTQLINAATEV